MDAIEFSNSTRSEVSNKVGAIQPPAGTAAGPDHRETRPFDGHPENRRITVAASKLVTVDFRWASIEKWPRVVGQSFGFVRSSLKLCSRQPQRGEDGSDHGNYAASDIRQHRRMEVKRRGEKRADDAR
jgi:hypothetical protein